MCMQLNDRKFIPSCGTNSAFVSLKTKNVIFRQTYIKSVSRKFINYVEPKHAKQSPIMNNTELQSRYKLTCHALSSSNIMGFFSNLLKMSIRSSWCCFSS